MPPSPSRGTLVATALVASAVALAVSALRLDAYPTGFYGLAQSKDGCICHSLIPNANGPVTVSIEAPKIVLVGSRVKVHVTVSGGPAGTGGGFNFQASAGQMFAGENAQASGSQATHANPSARSWDLEWQAPLTPQIVSFWAVGQCVNGDDTNENDSWNWYGDTPGTPFEVSVEAEPVAVGDAPLAAATLRAFPNPFAAKTNVVFARGAGAGTGAEAGGARLEVHDVRGRLVRAIDLAGGGVVTWDGRDDAGASVAAGVYSLRVVAEGRAIASARVVRVDAGR
jgi:hypothetical protein